MSFIPIINAEIKNSSFELINRYFFTIFFILQNDDKSNIYHLKCQHLSVKSGHIHSVYGIVNFSRTSFLRSLFKYYKFKIISTN